VVARSIRVCSWNVEWFGLAKSDVSTEINAGETIATIIRNLHTVVATVKKSNPDILCIQEVASPDTIAKLMTLLPSYKLWTPKIESAGHQYNVIITNSGVNVTDHGVLETTPKMVYVVIDNDTVVMNIHLRSDYTGDNSIERQKQIAVLLKWLDSRKFKNILVCGDFNSNVGSFELKMMDEQFINLMMSRKYTGSMAKKNSIWMDKNSSGTVDLNELFLIDHFYVNYGLFKKVSDVYIDRLVYEKVFKYDSLDKISDHYPIIFDYASS
jgi:endonuclease/exonuclease/phosphatase family metal-dependent hydrolase